MKTNKINIFDYVDYHSYLSFFYRKNKSLVPGFSYRSVARIARLKSANYLKLIIDGQRKLTESIALKLSPALQLSELEESYFLLMLRYTNSRQGTDKESLLREMLAMRHNPQANILSDDQIRICEKWYYVIILQSPNLPECKSDPKWIAKTLGISTSEARSALKNLILWGLLKEERGRLIRIHRNCITEDEIDNAYLKIYHRDSLEQASRKIFEQSVEEREYQSLTFSVHPSQIPILKKKIKAFKNEILALTNEPNMPPEEIYQFNVNLFRATEKSTDA